MSQTVSERCFCGRAHPPFDCVAPYDANHPSYRPDIWDLAVEAVDLRRGHTIDFASSPEGHHREYEEEYGRLIDQRCSDCRVLRKNCHPGGRYYEVCPFNYGDGHRFR